MNKKLRIKACTALAAMALCLPTARAKDRPSRLPLLVIGASYSEGKTPFNNGVAPLGGMSVGLGSYLALGQALTRSELLPGHVINEAQGGSGTFARPYCAPGAASCGPAGWESYQTQLEKALARVAVPPAFASHNARYLVVTMPNDCLHADAFGIAQSLSQPCTPAQMNASVDRMVALGQSALARGITPIFDVHPRYRQLNLPLFRDLSGLAWVIGEADYNTLRELMRTRLKAELPQAIVLDMWKELEHIGDGIHPDAATVKRAARAIAQELIRRDGHRP
ncbi:MAG: SGNH/GDSL hydrolase family protein [Pseudomonadota bacterium]